jgi:molecular chaperone GrpE
MTEEDVTSEEDDRSSSAPDAGAHTDEPGEQRASTAVTPDSVDEELLEHVENSDSKALAQELHSLRQRAESAETARDELASEVDDLEERVQRIQADFQNYKKRTERRREEEEARATQALVERLLPVRENLNRAVDHDSNTDIRDGVEATLEELDTVLEHEGVRPIEPSSGDEVDPTRHEVVHREDDDADSIASVYRRGYEMGGTVIRPAQVTVGAIENPETANSEPDEEPS